MDIDPAGPRTAITVDLITDSRAEAQRFYGELLGWTFGAATDTVDCTAGGVVVASLIPRGRAPVAGWRTCFAGFPGGAIADRVREAGGRILPPPRGSGATVHVTDPAGASFAVAGTPSRPPVSPGPGRPVWHENMATDARAVDPFYYDTLGLATVAPGAPEDGEDASEADYALLTLSGHAVAGRLVVPTDLAAMLPLGWMVYFAHDDVDGAAARAERRGGSVVVPPRDAPTGRVAALADPEGAVFTVIRPA